MRKEDQQTIFIGRMVLVVAMSLVAACTPPPEPDWQALFDHERAAGEWAGRLALEIAGLDLLTWMMPLMMMRRDFLR